MKLSDIESLWSEDAKIDEMNLGNEALKISKLHAKYHSILNMEKMILHKQKTDLDKLSLLLESYLAKTLTQDELKSYGFPDYSEKKILRTDFQKHIDTWPDVVDQKLKIGVQNDKIVYLNDIIKMIHNRNFAIKSAVDWAKFTNGAV